MRNPIALAGLLLLVGFATGACVLHIGGDGSSTTSWSSDNDLTRFRDGNRRKLDDLEIGMTRERVEAVMGSDEVWGGDNVGWIHNPYRTESFNTRDGGVVRVEFYYTSRQKADDMITDDELTPVAFRDGDLIGWGWTYFKRDVRSL